MRAESARADRVCGWQQRQSTIDRALLSFNTVTRPLGCPWPPPICSAASGPEGMSHKVCLFQPTKRQLALMLPMALKPMGFHVSSQQLGSKQQAYLVKPGCYVEGLNTAIDVVIVH